MKLCNKCKTELPDDMFYKRTYPSGRVALQNKCKECQNIGRAKYYKRHENLRRVLKISDVEYNTLIEKSQGRCAVCNKAVERLCIDHCHDTNKVRGMLCHNCNTALGLVGDSVETLSNLIRYLER